MRFRKGTIMAVTFDDHCKDGSAPITFTVFGRVSKVSKEFVCLDTWAYADTNVPYDDNVERYTILRKTITKAKVLAVVA